MVGKWHRRRWLDRKKGIEEEAKGDPEFDFPKHYREIFKGRQRPIMAATSDEKHVVNTWR
jgi:hypothetical protein